MKRSIIVVGFIIGIALTSLSVRAATDDGGKAASVIVNIQQSASEVSTQVQKELTTRINNMAGRWEKNLQRTLELLELAKKEGRPEQVDQFESQLSKTLQEAGQDLSGILDQQKSARASLDKLTGSLARGITFFGEQKTRLQSETVKVSEDRQKLEHQLIDIAKRHRDVILNGQLPPEVDALVRAVEVQRRTLELREQVKQQTAEVVAAQVRDLARYAAYVKRLRELSEEAFLEAQGQLLILGDLGELRYFGVSVTQTSRAVAQFGKETVSFSKVVQQTQGLLDRLISLPLPQELTKTDEQPVVELKPGQGAEILKRYLNNVSLAPKR